MEETKRQLVVVKKIGMVMKHPNADALDLCTVGGWTVISKLNEFKEGDLCVFYEIDSFLPNIPLYEFLGKTITHQDKEGYRLRSMKLRGALSQGLALPLSSFPELNTDTLKEGDDLTEMLDVTKYDVDLSGKKGNASNKPGEAKGNFPNFIPKTDEPRIQNLPHYFDLYKDKFFEETLKLDGSSMTCYKIEGKGGKIRNFIDEHLFGLASFISPIKDHFGVCSRNLELKRPTASSKKSNFWDAAMKYKLERDLPIGFAVQGEVLATNIQGNYEKVSEVQYNIYKVYDISEKKHLPPKTAQKFVKKFLPLAQYVPLKGESDFGMVKIFDVCKDFNEFQERVTGPSINKDVKSEGRVYKSQDGRITFKCVSNAYLLSTSK